MAAGPAVDWKKLCRESTWNRVKPEARELVLLDKQLAEEAREVSQQPPK